MIAEMGFYVNEEGRRVIDSPYLEHGCLRHQ